MFFFIYIIIFKLNIVLYLIPQLFVISFRLLWFTLTWGSSILDNGDQSFSLKLFQVAAEA